MIVIINYIIVIRDLFPLEIETTLVNSSVNKQNFLKSKFFAYNLWPKNTKPNCKYIKAVQTPLYDKSNRKMLVKLTPYIESELN